MPDPLQGTATTQAQANAEAARIDAQLELAAKKAALRGLEAQANGGDAPAALAPVAGAGTGSVTVTIGDKTVTIDNPSEAQLAQITGVAPQGPPVESWAIVAMTGMTFGLVIVVTALLLKHFRSRQRSGPAEGHTQADVRMARIENAVESIAVEVERISENQRFTTRLLSEGAAVPFVAADRADAILENRGNR
jgi:hypothetical protein